MEITDLRSKLMRIVEDYRFQVTLQEGCLDAIETYSTAKIQYFRQQRAGRRATFRTAAGRVSLDAAST